MNTTLPHRLLVEAKPALDVVNRYLSETLDTGRQIDVADFAAKMRAASGEVQVATGQPLRRMLYPGALHRGGTESDGRNSVIFFVSKDGLMASYPGQPAALATATLIKKVYDTATYSMVAVDPRAASALQSACERSESTKTTAAAIEVLRHMEVSTKLTILDQALSQTFWAPDEAKERSLSYWATLFGVPSDPNGWRQLMGACLYDPSRFEREKLPLRETRYNTYVEKIYETETDKMDKVLGMMTPVSAATLFDNQATIGEIWNGIQLIDPLLRPMFLATGEVIELKDAKWQGNKVAARVSVPCRMKYGANVLVCFEDGSIVDAQLGGLDYTDHLIGKFQVSSAATTPARGEKPSARYQDLTKVAQAPGRKFATTAPYLRGNFGGGTVYKWTSMRPENRPKVPPLEMPVDIAIAGAPDA